MGSSVRKGKAVLPAEQAARPSREQPHRAATEDYHHEAQTANNGQAITASCKNKDTDLQFKIQAYIDKNTVMIFSNTACSLSAKVKELFKSMSVPYCSLELDQTGEALLQLSFLYANKYTESLQAPQSFLIFPVTTSSLAVSANNEIAVLPCSLKMNFFCISSSWGA
nr:thioredoxin reductase 1, cytoplasmic-like isoform X2 [Chrysemys picta bellii]